MPVEPPTKKRAPEKEPPAEKSSATETLSAAKRALLDRLLQGASAGPTNSATPAPVSAGASIPRRGESGPAALSFAQERLWFLDQFEPEVPFYNVTGAFRLRGHLDPHALEATLRHILDRHQVLRSRIETTADGPRQRVLPLAADHHRILPRVDLSGLPPLARQEAVRHLAAAEARRPFRLSGDLLLRTTLLAEHPEDHLLLLSLHHIAADGWSIGVLFRELAELYRSLVSGRPPVLAPLSIQYADFAEWQRRWLESGELERQLGWWRQALDHAPTVLELPADRPRQPVQSFRGHTLRGHLGAELTRALELRAEASGATLFMLLLAAFQTLLWRYTGVRDLLVGSPIANRNRLETEPLIGFFVNTLVLRGRPTADTSVAQLLAEVKRTTLGAYDHQDLPFEKLVEALEPPRDLSRSPLFQVLLVLQNTPTAPLELPGLTLTMEQLDSGTAKFDLLLSLLREGDQLVPWIEYSTDLYDPSTIDRLLRHWNTLLRALVDSGGDTPLDHLDLLSTGERNQLLEGYAWPDPPATDQPLDIRPVPIRFCEIAERFPHRVALEHVATDGQPFTASYGELLRHSRELATRLRREGARPDQPIAICLERGPELAVALLAVLETGCACLPLDPAYPPARLEHMLHDAAPCLLLTTSTVLRTGGDGPTPLSAELPGPRRIDLDTWSTTRPDTDTDAPPAVGEAPVEPGQLAYVLYTSGSTGRPKGVAMPHDPFARLMSWQLPRARSSRTLQFAPLSFDVSMQEHFATWLAGGTLVLVDDPTRRDPQALWRHLTRHRVERLFLPFVALQQLAETAPEHLPPLRDVVTAGEQLRITPALRRLFRRLPRARLENQYGPSETHVVTAETLPADPGTWPALPSIGRPVAGASVWVLDGNLELLPVGIPGELCIGGDALARGYLSRPAATAERLVPDPHCQRPGARLYKTGDLARFRQGGILDFLGRRDQQVKVRGFRIELGEIEAVLGEHPAVAEALVAAPATAEGERNLAAFVVLRPAPLPTIPGAGSEELRRFLHHRLPAHMVPATVQILDRLPLTPSGKIDRRAAARLVATPLSVAGHQAPRDAIEEAVAAIWGELLGRDPRDLDRRADFFELGGHSLLATRVVSRVREWFGVELAVRTLFEAPTLARLAQRIAAATRSPMPPITAEPGATSAPLSFAQERLWFLEQLEPGNPAYHLPVALTLAGPLDCARLAAAFDRLVARHGVLTATFSAEGGVWTEGGVPTEDGVPRQFPGAAQAPGLAVIDLRSAGAAAENHARALARTESRRPFDLATGPLLRARLLRLSDEVAWLLLIQHHIISDGWSLGILLQELGTLYRTLENDADASLPRSPISYFDFARWQRRCLTGEALEAQVAWWRQRLAPPRARLELPTDRPRLRQRTHRRGDHLEHTLDPEASAAVLAFGREVGATPFMVLLAAFEVVVARWSGETDLLVGCPVAGRTRRQTEDLVGFFIDTLVLRTDLSADPSFRDAVLRVRETALGAFAHQDLPFEQLVQALDPERDLDRPPLFQVFFNVLNFDPIELDLPGIEVTPSDTGRPDAKFDLTLYAQERGDRLHFDLIYDRDLFDPERMRALLAQLGRLLALGVAHRDTPVAVFDLRPPDPAPLPDPRQSLPLAPPSPPIHLRVLARAAARPEAIALEAQNGDGFTYGELAHHSARVANLLLTVGAGPGTVVAIEAPKIPALAGALLGVWRTGAAFLLLDPAHPPARKAAMLQQARPIAWLGTGGPPPELAASGPAFVPLELPLEAPTEAVDGPTAHPALDDLAYLAFTSGSSGRPKGIRGTHRPLCHFLDLYRETFGITPDDRFTALSGIGHDPLLRDLLVPLATGARVLLPDLTHPAEALRWLGEKKATVAHLTPSLAELLATDGEAGETSEASETDASGDLGSGSTLEYLRLAGFGGEALHQRDIDRWLLIAPRATCWNFYGATETPQVVAWQQVPAGGPSGGRLPIGRGIDGVQLLVFRPGSGEPRLAAVGELGEIVVRSPYLATGYLDTGLDEAGNGAVGTDAFGPDPFGADAAVGIYHTGDLGRYRPDGSLELAGRADRQLEIRGIRIEPAEIETVLGAHPAVRHAAVVAAGSSTGAPVLWAFVSVQQPGDELTHTLREHLVRHLPTAFVPRLVLLDALPRTHSGKVDLRALVERAQGLQAATIDPGRSGEAPRGASEVLVAEVWARVLGLATVGRHQSFFELGGHSLLAVKALARLRRALGHELPLRGMFEHPTVARFAAWVDQRSEVVQEISLEAGPAGPAPLSPAQQRLWFLDQLDPGPAYNMPVALRLSGTLDPAALHDALERVLDRHRVLRSSFEQTEAGPTQTPRAGLEVPLHLFDLCSLPRPRAEREAVRRLRAAARLPFDLRHPPLVRLVLIRLAPECHDLLLTLHHIAADAWSFAILLAELQHLISDGAPQQLPALPVQVADVARWQGRRQEREQRLAASLEIMTRRLSGAPTLELPGDFRRPVANSANTGGRHTFELPAELVGGLGGLCAAVGATPYMGWLAALQVLLGRLAGQPDVVVGTAVAGRDRPEIEPLIGLFVNTLPLRGTFADSPSFSQLVVRTRDRVLEAHAHRELPFELLVEALAPERRLDQNPIFQVMFVLQNQEPARFELPGVTAEPLAVDTGAAKFDLVLHLVEDRATPVAGTAGAMGAWLEYRRDRLSPTTVDRLARAYQQLLNAAVAEPERAVDTLPLLSPAQRHQLLTEWNDTHRGPGESVGDTNDGPRHLAELFFAQAARRPDAVALLDGRSTLTYGALAHRARHLGRYLRSLGVGRGQPVAVHLPRDPELAVALLGVLAAGGSFVPLDLAFPAERVAWILRRLAVPVLITSRGRLLELHQSRPWTEAAPDCAELVLPLDPGSWPAAATDIDTGTDIDTATQVDIDDPAYIIFTSGSTGQPKGVVVRHRPVLELIQWVCESFGIGPDDRVAWVASAGFDLSVFDLFGLLAAGGSVRVVGDEERRDPAAMVDLLYRDGITFWDSAPPSLARLVPFFHSPSARDQHRLRTVFLSGDWIPVPLPDQVRRCFPGARVIALGGATEAVIWSNVYPVGAVDPAWPSIPYGRPIRGARYHVLDPSFAPCPLLVEGDLYIGGTCLADGYVGAALTAERFCPDPFGDDPGGRLYKTGDRARVLADGTLEFRGRCDQQIKLRGYRIELGEIEAVLGRHPAVQQAVAGVRELAGDRQIVAWVVAMDGERVPEAAELRDTLSRHLPEYMVPAVFVPLEALPITNNGKLDRSALPLPEPAADTHASEPPRGPDEETVATVWCEVLDLRQVGRHDHFFELGGHSLSATRVIAALRHHLGVELPLRELFESPTVRELAAALAARRSAASPAFPWPTAVLAAEQRRAPLLSFAQERLWFLHRLEPELAVYNIPLALEMAGDLDARSLARALDALETRHDVLRRQIHNTSEGPRQVLSDGRRLRRVDLSETPATDREGRLAQHLDEEARRPFDLESGPLWRTTLLHLEDHRHALLVTFHHLVADGWSLGIFLHELGALYTHYLTSSGPASGHTTSHAAALPALEITYVDLAAQQRRWLEAGGLEPQLDYWKQRLAGLPPLLELPTDRPRPRTATHRGGRRPLRLEPPLVGAVDHLARQAGATRFMVLLAALGGLLHRITHSDDLAVGSAVAGRHRAESEGLIGLFANSLVLRLDLGGATTGRQLLHRARQITFEAHDHQDMPFERLVEELDPQRGGHHNPLFQVMLVLQNTPIGPVQLPGLHLCPLPADSGLAKFDLQLALDDGRQDPRGAILGSLDYARDLFDPTTAERLGRGFRQLLTGLCAQPERRIDELPLLAPGESHQVTVEWNPGSPAPLSLPLGTTLGDCFTAVARTRPQAPALTAGGETLSYRQLETRANQLAWHLRQLGVGPETPVALYLDRDAELVIALLAVLLAGGAYLPMDPAYPAERLIFMLEDSAAPVFLSQEKMLRTLDPAVGNVLRGRAVVDLDGIDLDRIDPDRIDLDRIDPDRIDLEIRRTSPPPPLAGPDHLAYIIYTSGSTGRPKGTAITHTNALRLFAATGELFRFGPRDVIPLFHSPAFDFSVWELWSALLFGGRLVVVPYLTSRSPGDFRRLLAAEGATVVNQTPSAFRQLEEADRLALSEHDGELRLRLRLVIFGGEALDFASLQAWIERHGDSTNGRGPRLINGYGITETTVFITFRRVRATDLAASPGSYIGQAMPDLDLLVLDPRGRPVPLGTWGELLVGGPGLGRGYLGRPALTARRFVPHPHPRTAGERLYRSGDLVRYRGDGDLEYQGRLDHQVQLRGFRVELGEIEAALAAHPDLAAVVVLVREDSPTDARLVAYLVAVEGAAVPTAEALRSYLDPRLPPYMIPSLFVPLADGLPLTANGKADRKALDRLALPVGEDTSAASFAAPRNEVERRLAELWQEVLGVERVGIDDNFFDLGGHSVLLTRLHRRIEEVFGRIVPLVELFHHPKIRSFAECLGSNRQSPAEAAKPATGAATAAAETTAEEPPFQREKQRAARQIAALKRRSGRGPRRPR